MTTQAVSLDAVETQTRSEGLWSKAWRRFLRHRLALIGSITLLVMVVLAVIAPVVAPYSPIELNLEDMSQPPSLTHWLGTDTTGRDVWARTVYAGRVSLSVGLVAVAISTVLGILIGSLAGYAGGWLDMALMRFTDMVMTFPTLVIIIAAAAILGPSVLTTMIVIGGLGWAATARLVRGQFLSLREQQFVLAARSIGVAPIEIAFKHVFPNVIGTVAVAATFGMATAILLEATLSFLGLGVQVPTPSWGNMLRDAQTPSTLENLPWLWLAPGVMIALAVLSINFIGDGLRDALDPRTIL